MTAPTDLLISPDFQLPRSTVTSTLLVYGGKGMGKSNCGAVVLEEMLRKGAREILDVLVRHRGRALYRENLAEAVGMEVSGGTFAAYLSDLRQAGLIVVDREGVRANEETLFL